MLIRAFHRIIADGLYLILWPYFRIRAQTKPDEWRQRLALRPAEYIPVEASGALWGHASSVGEIKVLRRVMTSLQKTDTSLRFCISAYTVTGLALAKELFPEAQGVFLLPLDCRLPLTRLLDLVRPRGIITVETEIWPYLLHVCRRRGIPCLMANGRLSEKSLAWYRPFRGALRPLLACYKAFVMQTEADAARLAEIGADPAKITIAGNIKHDLNQEANGNVSRREVRNRLHLCKDHLFFIAASTRPGEEDMLCSALGPILLSKSRLVVMFAPRHLERLDEVRAILTKHNLPFVSYSDLESGSDLASIVLMDKMGLLANLFYGADLAFVGGTLVDIGGHNLMEPVVAGVPVLFGPSIFNVPDAAAQIIAQRHGLMVHNVEELRAAIRGFIDGAVRFAPYSSGGESAADKTAQIIAQEFNL